MTSTVGKVFPLLCGKAVEQYAPLLQQFRDLGICHLAVADNPVDEESALAVLPVLFSQR